MEIPRFKPSKTFVDGMKIPCLIAKLKNSKVAGLGASYRAEVDEDPVFQVYLRGGNSKDISPWQQQMLERLFSQDELLRAITEGMKEYESSTGYNDSDEIRRDGILPHLYLSDIIIDEIEQNVIICASALADGCLGEHGIAIHLQEGRWKFDYLDYVSNYLRGLDHEAKGPAKSDAVLTAGDLYGIWAFDEAATSKRMNTRGMQSDLKSTLDDYRGMYFEIAEDYVRCFREGMLVEGKLVKCESQGREIHLTFRVPGDEFDGSFGGKLLKNGSLVTDDAVFRQLAPNEPLPASPWTEMDLTLLLGLWESDPAGTNMTFSVEITPGRILLKPLGATNARELRWTRCVRNGTKIRFDLRLVSPEDSVGKPYPVVIEFQPGRLRWQTWPLSRKSTVS
jgi:hypothetical protein